ncbi:MAG: type I phosphomannose isomerase catalytic subunit [Kineosporiaceae bacterium]
MDPLHLDPLLVEKPWGGRRLAALGRRLPEGVPVGESWDVADLDPAATPVPDPASRVAHGPLAGRALADVIASDGDDLLGAAPPTASGRFPLLVKHLDAREHLSVQVHPPAAVVPRFPGSRLKTESWVVVAAEPGAELFLGVVDGVAPDDVEKAAGTPDLVPMLRRVPARVGDVHHLPAGLLHALGAGVLVAEPQTPSDTTFRLYDWTEEYGRAPRVLHLDESLACLRAEWGVNLSPPAPVVGDGVVVDTEHYSVTRTTSGDGGRVAVPSRPTARVVVVIRGRLAGGALAVPLGPGQVVVLPAAWAGPLAAEPGTTWLDVDLGSAGAREPDRTALGG